MHKGIDRLLGNAVHKVKIDVLKARAARIVERSLRLGDAVRPAESLQLAGNGALHAYAKTVDTQPTYAAQTFRIDRRGIGLHRYLGALFYLEVAPYTLDDALYVRQVKIGRRAAADVNGVYLVRTALVAPVLHLEQERVCVMLHHRAVVWNE